MNSTCVARQESSKQARPNRCYVPKRKVGFDVSHHSSGFSALLHVTVPAVLCTLG
jgi:hypothetical protein